MKLPKKVTPVGEIIESKSKGIAQLLTRQEDGDLVDTLTFS